MGCRKERKRIQESLDVDMSPAAEAKMFAHLDRCSGCRSYMEQMVALRRAAGVRRLDGRSEAYWKSYWPRLKPGLAGRHVRRPGRVVGFLKNPAFGLAAVCAAVFVLMIRFNLFVFDASVTVPASTGVIAPLRGPGDYRHVLGSSSRRTPVSDARLDTVIDPAGRISHKYVLVPARGGGVTGGMGTVAI